MVWHVSHKLMHTISIFEAWEMPSGVFFLQHAVIVHLDNLLLDPSLDIFVLFMHRKLAVGIVL